MKPVEHRIHNLKTNALIRAQSRVSFIPYNKTFQVAVRFNATGVMLTEALRERR